MSTSKNKDMQVVLWGFNGEGKTHLLYQGLKGIKDFKTTSTLPWNIENININGIDMTIWDIGGRVWFSELYQKKYLSMADVLIFCIDSTVNINDLRCDYERFEKCLELIEDKPLLVAITKIDKRIVRTYDIIETFKLNKLFERKQKFGIIECSSYTTQGIKEIKFWLSNIIKK